MEPWGTTESIAESPLAGESRHEQANKPTKQEQEEEKKISNRYSILEYNLGCYP